MEAINEAIFTFSTRYRPIRGASLVIQEVRLTLWEEAMEAKSGLRDDWPSSEQLLGSIQRILSEGDEDAEEIFFNLLYRRIRIFVRAKLNGYSDHDVEDVVQETIVAVKKNLEKIENPWAFVFAVARRKIVDHVRRAEKAASESMEDYEEKIPSQVEGPDEIAEKRDHARYYQQHFDDRMKSLVKLLTEREKQVYELLQAGCPRQVIAKELGIGKSRVSQIISAVKRKMKGLDLLE